MNAASPIATAPPSISDNPAIIAALPVTNAAATPEVTANDATKPSFSPSITSRTQLPPAACTCSV